MHKIRRCHQLNRNRSCFKVFVSTCKIHSCRNRFMIKNSTQVSGHEMNV